MSSNAYRQTESFYRRLEQYLVRATTLPIDKWAELPPDTWKASTFATNLRFGAMAVMKEHWETDVDLTELATRWNTHSFMVNESLSGDVVVWQPRTHSRQYDHALKLVNPALIARPPVDTNLTQLQQSSDLSLSIEDFDTLKALIHCIHKGIGEPQIFWGECTKEHRALTQGTSVTLTQMRDSLGRAYVIVS